MLKLYKYIDRRLHPDMKKWVLIVFLGVGMSSFAQVDSSGLYFQALVYYNSHLDSLNSSSTEIFIENNDGITDRFPSIIGTRTVTILTRRNQREVYKKNNNKIRHVKIFPARISGEIIEVVLAQYVGKFKRNKQAYLLSAGEWVIIQFKYDCTDGKCKYFKTVTGGI